MNTETADSILNLVTADTLALLNEMVEEQRLFDYAGDEPSTLHRFVANIARWIDLQAPYTTAEHSQIAAELTIQASEWRKAQEQYRADLLAIVTEAAECGNPVAIATLNALGTVN